MNLIRGRSGQALVESLAFFVVLAGILVTFVGFTKWFLMKQKLLMAARSGAMLYSSGHLQDYEVKARLRHYLASGSPTFLTENVTIRLGSAVHPRAHSWRLDKVQIEYRPASPIVRLIQPVMEEQCVIKHAPHYGPGGQNLFGPPILWKSGQS